MKTLKLTTLLLAVALVFGSTSCKYEEGPGISLRTKKARVAGEWTIEKSIDEDGTVDNDWEGYTSTFEKDGTGKISYTYTFAGSTTTDNSIIKWEFTDSKKKIKMTDEDGDAEVYTIIRLTNKEMWLKDSDNDQYNYKSK